MEMRFEKLFTVLSLLLLDMWAAMARRDVYIVTMEGEPVISYKGDVPGFEPTAIQPGKKFDGNSELVISYARHLEKKHDWLLGLLFGRSSYKKLYSYRHLINGFSVHLSSEQAKTLRHSPGVKSVERDLRIQRLTTHTPQFLGLPSEVWPSDGGIDLAGEGIVIGVLDSGIHYRHPSFAPRQMAPFNALPNYKGKCESDTFTNRSFCNGKIIGAQHFAKAATAFGDINYSADYTSPMDDDGHGSHTAAIAAGNNGITLKMHGYEFGNASGMAPSARIAVYKVLYGPSGGFVADVVAAIEQAVQDGIDIISLSVGPNGPPESTRVTFLNPFDITLLAAAKAGVFVVQAAGNGGPSPKSLVSYSPWITTVAAAIDDRRYQNTLTLGNGKKLHGTYLSPSTHGNGSYTLVAAGDALLHAGGNTSDCQDPDVFDKTVVSGRILLCGYSFGFVEGSASIKKVWETSKRVGAAGFVVVVEDDFAVKNLFPVPVAMPGIAITNPISSKDLIKYYATCSPRDSTGKVITFNGVGKIGDGLKPVLRKSSPQVAIFSARGPNVKDFSFNDADLLKPDILAPGSLIWAAWSPNGTDDPNFAGESFAMKSGTSMAAPHISGIAALIKQKHPGWSPAAVKSALMTTSTKLDRAGRSLLAQLYTDKEAMRLAPAVPFDYGSGHVNPRAALDPGLVFDAGYEDYVGFLCATPGIDVREVMNYTNTPCGHKMSHPADLNVPSIAVARLGKTLTLARTVTNVAEQETYVISARMDPAIAIAVDPPAMTLKAGASRMFTVTLSVRSVTGSYCFGEVLLKGSRGHRVRIPVAVMAARGKL